MCATSSDVDDSIVVVGIIGAGPAGIACAAALRATGVQVWLVDPGRHKVGEALDPAVRPLIARIAQSVNAPSGVPAGLNAPGVVSCWESEVPQDSAYVSGRWGSALHVDRAPFEAALARQLDVTIMPHTAVSLEGSPGAWTVALDDGQHLPATALIDASGRRAWLLRQLGIARLRQGRQVAFVAGAGHRSADRRLHVEACEHGWWYAAPLLGDRCAVALLTDADLPPAKIARRAGGLAELCAQTTLIQSVAGPLDDAVPVGRAADSERAAERSGPGWLAIGDAAQAMDPLTGFGVPAAMQMGLQAASALTRGDTEALIAAQDAVWAHYQRELAARHRAAARRFAGAEYWRRRV